MIISITTDYNIIDEVKKRLLKKGLNTDNVQIEYIEGIQKRSPIDNNMHWLIAVQVVTNNLGIFTACNKNFLLCFDKIADDIEAAYKAL